jgi:putative ABC transport system ATP-binding protein
MQPVVELRAVNRKVNGYSILKDISFELFVGEVLAVIGPSGSGKTSLLRVINRLDEPTSGEIIFQGEDYREISPVELRQRAGLVMQKAILLPGSVADNIRFGPAQRGISLTDQEINQLLKQVDLEGFRDREISNLSGGEAQRICLARALANQPQVLLLDEPTSALDEDSRAGVEALMAEVIREQKIPCVWVTHQLSQAARMATRVLVLDKGKLVKVGKVDEVLNAQSMVS